MSFDFKGHVGTKICSYSNKVVNSPLSTYVGWKCISTLLPNVSYLTGLFCCIVFVTVISIREGLSSKKYLWGLVQIAKPCEIRGDFVKYPAITKIPQSNRLYSFKTPDYKVYAAVS